MNQKILFSPVGGTDPISSSNCRDGSLLHICRVYQPDIVYLYMSYEMLKFQEEDDRYQYCLNQLCELQNRKMEYRIIERGNLKNVQKFDYFYDDFRKIMLEIMEEMDETDTLFLNVSSGTPAMKSGLLVLNTLGEFPCKAIQVVTPERSLGEHVHKGYDVETLWELNEDNCEEFENRCEEVLCPTLSVIKNEEIVKRHVVACNYSAAVEVAEGLPKERTEGYMDLLRMAEARLQLDFCKSDPIAKKHGISYCPVQSGNEKIYFEYALNLDVKRRKKEYADFIRGLTPLITDLFERILKIQTKINIDDFRKDYQPERWDERKLKESNVETELKRRFPNFNYGNIQSVHLLTLIEAFGTDQKMIELMKSIRDIETGVRNQAAHEIVSLTDDKIKKNTGFNSRQIMEKIKSSFLYAGINIKKEYWESYQKMNEQIIEVISSNVNNPTFPA